MSDTQRGSIAERIFAQSAGAFLGVERPTVPAGDSSYATMTAGATADARLQGVAKDAEAATFKTVTVSPFRVTSRYLFDIESTVKLAGMEQVLRSDLSAVLTDRLDYYAINGAAGVASTSPEVDGILSETTAPTDPSDAATANDFMDAYLDRVDGKRSVDGTNVRLLVNADAFRAARKLRTTDGTLLSELPAGRFRVSANLPATASTISTGLTYTAGYRGLVQPVWRAATFIRDPYTESASGQVALTIHLLTGAKMLDASAYSRIKFKVS